MNQAVYGALLATSVCLPLVFIPVLNDAFELPKVALLRVLVCFALLAAAPGHFPGATRRRLEVRAAVVVLGAWTLCTVLSVSLRLSWWGSYERWTGLLTQISFIALFLLTAASVRTSERLWTLAKVISATGAFSALYALAQRLGWDPLVWSMGIVWSGQLVSGADRPFSTLGNPDFLASYLVLSTCVATGIAFQQSTAKPAGWLLAWGSVLVQAVALALTGSRAGWTGIVVGVAVLVSCRSANSSRKWLQRFALTLGVVVVCVACVWALTAVGLPIGRVSSVFDLSASSTRERLVLWAASLRLIVERPLAGFGPDTFGSIVTRDYPVELLHLEPPDFVVDRVHNATLQVLVSAGVVGLGALTMLIGTVVMALRRLLPVRGIIAGIAAALTAHIVEQQFNVEVIASSATAWMLAGAAVGLAQNVDKSSQRTYPWRGRVTKWSGAAVALVLAALTVWTQALPVTADFAYARGLEAERAGDMRGAVTEFETATSRWPEEPAYANELARAQLAVARASSASGSASAYTRAVAAAARARDLDPANAVLLSSWALIASEASVRLSDNRLARAADAGWREAIARAPGYWLVWRSAGAAAFNLGNLSAARADFRRASELFDGDGATWSALGDTDVRLGDVEPGREAYTRALQLQPDDAHARAELERLNSCVTCAP